MHRWRSPAPADRQHPARLERTGRRQTTPQHASRQTEAPPKAVHCRTATRMHRQWPEHQDRKQPDATPARALTARIAARPSRPANANTMPPRSQASRRRRAADGRPLTPRVTTARKEQGRPLPGRNAADSPHTHGPQQRPQAHDAPQRKRQVAEHVHRVRQPFPSPAGRQTRDSAKAAPPKARAARPPASKGTRRPACIRGATQAASRGVRHGSGSTRR
jgi:hypothetical protein